MPSNQSGLLQDHDVLKRRLDSTGKPLHEEGEAHKVGPEEDDTLLHTGQEGDNSTCGSCYGANSTPEQCCNTCEEVTSCFLATSPTWQHLQQLPQIRQSTELWEPTWYPTG